MRRLGVGILGLFCGLLAGFVVNEVIALAVLGATGSVAPAMPWVLVLRAVIPVLGAVGVLVALAIDRNGHHAHGGRGDS